MKNSLLFILLFFINYSIVSSQIVRIDDNLLKQDTSNWHGLLKLNFSIIEGRKQLFQILTGTQVRYRTGKSTLLSANDLRIIITAKENIESKGFQHFRYQRWIDSTFTWEGFNQFQFDKVLRIKFRLLIGTGPRINFYHKRGSDLVLGVSYMFEHDQEIENLTVGNYHRMSSYIRWTEKIGKNSSFNLIGYYQPRLDKWSDYRLSVSSGLMVPLIKNLLFQLNFEFTYDSAPFGNVLNRYYNISNGFSYKF